MGFTNQYRLLKLREMLFAETDERNELNLQGIMEGLTDVFGLVKLTRAHRQIYYSHQVVLKYHCGDYTVERNFALRRNGDFYYVEPYALI